MAESIAIFASINFAIIGLSHVFQAETWRNFFKQLHSIGKPGAFANGFITLIIGSLIVSFHNVWSGVPVVLTILGWCYVLKSTVIFIHPEWSLRSMKRAETAVTMEARLAGLGLLGVAVTMIMCVVLGQY